MNAPIPARPTASGLPALAPVRHIHRPLTVAEYYHAAIGRHPQSHIRSHEVVIVLEGTGTPDPKNFQSALNQAAEANPGARLRLTGQRQRARWISDAPPPSLRWIDDCRWDGRSSEGLAAVLDTELSLESGHTTEVILARTVGQADHGKIIFRTSHAVMDGMGLLHFIQETFRALRGEPLLGSNATFTDTDLMQHGPKRQALTREILQITHMMGPPRGDERGGVWRRITIPGPQPNLPARLVGLMAEYCRRHGDTEKSVRIGMPANLRRHIPDLLTTTNFAGMSYVDLLPAASLELEDIKQQLRKLREGHAEMSYRKIFEIMRWLPFAWVDGMLSVNEKNYKNPNLHETAILTILGIFKQTPFSGGGFSAETLYAIPQLENVFIAVSGFQGNFELTLGMPKVFASEGRMEDLLDFLRGRLTPQAPGK